MESDEKNQCFQLSEIQTSDGLYLQGMASFPPGEKKTAIIWVHGLVGAFYKNVLLMNEFARQSGAAGYGFVSFNTRGHDMLASAHKTDSASSKGYSYVTIGSSVEVFTDAQRDIDAMITFCISKGYAHVVLVGHSTGANKVCYYQAKTNDPRVLGVVLSGPMSDRYSYGVDEQTNASQKADMEKKIRNGKGDELLFGLDFFLLTPARWMSLLGKGSPEDVFNHKDTKGALATFHSITTPLCVVFGEQDEHADVSVQQIRESFDRHQSSRAYTSVVISGADHGFTGKEGEFVSVIVSWIASL